MLRLKHIWRSKPANSKSAQGSNSPSPLIKLTQNEINHLNDVVDGEITKTPWDCNIRSVLSDLITLHNADLEGKDPDVFGQFPPTKNRPMTTAELMSEDFAYLRNMNGTSFPTDGIAFEQVTSSKPNSQIINFKRQAQSISVVCFNSSFFYHVNRILMRLRMLMLIERNLAVLDQHRPIIASSNYDDKCLYLFLLQDIEALMTGSPPAEPDPAPYLMSPYEICEEIEGARRFVLCHELSHLLYPNHLSDLHLQKMRERLKTSFLCYQLDKDSLARSVLKLPPHEFISSALTRWAEAADLALTEGAIRRWTEELWCDLHAILMLEQSYEPLMGSKKTLFEVENMFIGIMQMFILFQFMEFTPIEEQIALSVTNRDLSQSVPHTGIRAIQMNNYFMFSTLAKDHRIRFSFHGRMQFVANLFRILMRPATWRGIEINVLDRIGFLPIEQVEPKLFAMLTGQEKSQYMTLQGNARYMDERLSPFGHRFCEGIALQWRSKLDYWDGIQEQAQHLIQLDGAAIHAGQT